MKKFTNLGHELTIDGLELARAHGAAQHALHNRSCEELKWFYHKKLVNRVDLLIVLIRSGKIIFK
jgi:hypothetical protein